MHRALLGCERETDELASETFLAEAIAALLRRFTDGALACAGTGQEPAHLDAVREFLVANYAAPVTLANLAAMVGLNPVYLVKAFRRRFGLAPHAYQQQLRVSAAQALLRRGDAIADVALATGFSDQSHQTRTFHRHLGVTPGR